MGATRDYQIANIKIIHADLAGFSLAVELEEGVRRGVPARQGTAHVGRRGHMRVQQGPVRERRLKPDGVLSHHDEARERRRKVRRQAGMLGHTEQVQYEPNGWGHILCSEPLRERQVCFS